MILRNQEACVARVQGIKGVVLQAEPGFCRLSQILQGLSFI